MELTLAQRLDVVRENMEKAAGGRHVTLVGAAKTKPAELIKEAIAAGLEAVGENYVQEFREKSAQGAYEGAQVHIIGGLQTNKVKYVAGKVDLIQSVDSAALLAAIGKRAASLDAVQDVLLEVNIGREPGKSGALPEELPSLLEAAALTAGVRVRGLMAIPPAENSRAYFDPMVHLFIDNRLKKYDNVYMDILSMGMSGDYEDAIRAGANMVRVGTYLFGARDYQQTTSV